MYEYALQHICPADLLQSSLPVDCLMFIFICVKYAVV